MDDLESHVPSLGLEFYCRESDFATEFCHPCMMMLIVMWWLRSVSCLHRQTIGTSAIRTAKRTDGRRPVTTPRMAGGMLLMNERNFTSGVGVSKTLLCHTYKLTASEVIDVADGTNYGNRDRPEYDHQGDEGRSSDFSQ